MSMVEDIKTAMDGSIFIDDDVIMPSIQSLKKIHENQTPINDDNIHEILKNYKIFYEFIQSVKKKKSENSSSQETEP